MRYFPIMGRSLRLISCGRRLNLFWVSDQFEVVVHPKAKQASVNKFPILDMNGVPINLPEDENYYPHPEALEWHKKEVFNKFSL